VVEEGQDSFVQTRTSGDRPPLGRVLALVRIDFPRHHHQPRLLRLAIATVVAILGSLAAEMVLVAIGTAIFPATRGYGHFQFSDYGKLTVIGVLVACVGWPIVTWISSSPRWLFFRLAIIVTLFLWLPDLWILAKGQPVRAVLVLIVMHLAIAVVTYNTLVRMAGVRPHRGEPS
jgi:hypothetical protein